MSDTAIQHKRVKMGMSDTEISTFWGAKIQHFWASQEYNIYMHIQGSSLATQANQAINSYLPKPVKPRNYKGKANIDVFEKWIFNVEMYFHLLNVDMFSREAVLRISPLLEGKAAQYF